MVAETDFSGLVSSACALASAAAMAPMDSLDLCMAGLRVEKIETHRAGLRSLGPNPMSDRFLGVLRHQALQLSLGFFVVHERLAGRSEHGGKLGPGIGRAHVDNPHSLDPRPRWLDAEEARGLAALNAAPELFLRGE